MREGGIGAVGNHRRGAVPEPWHGWWHKVPQPPAGGQSRVVTATAPPPAQLSSDEGQYLTREAWGHLGSLTRAQELWGTGHPVPLLYPQKAWAKMGLPCPQAGAGGGWGLLEPTGAGRAPWQPALLFRWRPLRVLRWGGRLFSGSARSALPGDVPVADCSGGVSPGMPSLQGMRVAVRGGKERSGPAWWGRKGRQCPRPRPAGSGARQGTQDQGRGRILVARAPRSLYPRAGCRGGARQAGRAQSTAVSL